MHAKEQRNDATTQLRHENITQPLVKTDNRYAWYHNVNKKDQHRTTPAV